MCVCEGAKKRDRKGERSRKVASVPRHLPEHTASSACCARERRKERMRERKRVDEITGLHPG